MNITDILIGKTIDSVTDGLDSLFTSDEERLKAKNKLEEIKSEAVKQSKELENEYQKEITKRWESDNQGNFITRSVRPLSLVYMLVLLTAFAFTDGNVGDFAINESYIELFKTLAVVSFTAYFGSKGVEIYKHGKMI